MRHPLASRIELLSLCVSACLCLSATSVAAAQSKTKPMPPPVTWTSAQDHQNMMDQLGITALRPGPSGNEKAPNHANYDESTANPYPNLPDPLRMNDGHEVTTPKQWWDERRPQIVHDYEEYVYGRVPAHVPSVHWTVVAVDHENLGGHPVIAKQLLGRVDNASDPMISVNIRMMLVTPANTTRPVPVLIMFGRTNFPAPNEPTTDELDRINAAEKAQLVQQDPSLKDVFAQHPAWEPQQPAPFVFPQFNADGDPPSPWELIAAGWGFATLDPQSVQADNGAGLTRGIIGLVNKGQPRTPDQWGSLRAWAWGAGRGLDYLMTDPTVDGKHVGIEGVSRYGKAALVTMAFDQRFAMVLVGSSGKGGATPLRRNFGEAVESLASSEEYHWMAGNFLKYATASSRFGSKTPGDLPVDSDELIALCAPRLTFISYGIPEKGDAKWLDQRGSFMATVAASPVFTLLGVKGLGVTENYHTAAMPPVNEGLLGGHLAWRQDDGGHTDAPNMKYFIQWVDNSIGYKPPQD
ncbi:MAG: acetylxylan esterase [Acidobacteriaceae bacterium]